MEELPEEELMQVEGGTNRIIESKLIQKHVKNREKYNMKEFTKIDGIQHNIFVKKANWVYGGNDCAVIINGRKYDAQNTNSFNKDKVINNATIEFYKNKPDSKALVYVELAFKINDNACISKYNIIKIYKVNVFID